jgi:multidrug resistance efflux pump
LRAPAAGRVVASNLALGRRVRRGDPLVIFDTSGLTARRAALGERQAALRGEAAARGAEEEAARRGLAEEELAQTAAAAATAASSRQAAAAAALAVEIEAREARLLAAGLLAAADAARSRAEAEERREAAAAASRAAEATAGQGRARLADRRAALARLDADQARLRADLAATAADLAAADRDLAQSTLRAPAAGLLSDVASLTAGAHVERGAALGTLIPDGRLAVAATFDSAALGALRPGQRAWVHIGAGPATPTLVVSALVAAVSPALAASAGGAPAAAANPAGGGGVTGPVGGAGGAVELTFDGGSAAARVPTLRAGQPCQVEVEVARTTPAALALRALTPGVLTGAMVPLVCTVRGAPAARAVPAAVAASVVRALRVFGAVSTGPVRLSAASVHGGGQERSQP